MAPAQASFVRWSRVSAHAAAQCPAEAKHHGNAGTSLPGPHSWDLAGLPGCSGVAVDKISCIPQGHFEMLGRNQRVALFPRAVAFVFQGLGVVVTSVLTSSSFSTFSHAFEHCWVGSNLEDIGQEQGICLSF